MVITLVLTSSAATPAAPADSAGVVAGASAWLAGHRAPGQAVSPDCAPASARGGLLHLLCTTGVSALGKHLYNQLRSRDRARVTGSPTSPATTSIGVRLSALSGVTDGGQVSLVNTRAFWAASHTDTPYQCYSSGDGGAVRWSVRSRHSLLLDYLVGPCTSSIQTIRLSATLLEESSGVFS